MRISRIPVNVMSGVPMRYLFSLLLFFSFVLSAVPKALPVGDALALFASRIQKGTLLCNSMTPPGDGVDVNWQMFTDIVLPAEPLPQERYAAGVLAACLKTAFGRDIPIVCGMVPNGHALYVASLPRDAEGNAIPSDRYGFDLDWMPSHASPFGYSISEEGGSLYLLGGGPTGCVYAVLSLLQEDLGIRFYTPDTPVMVPENLSPVSAVVPRSFVSPFEIREPLNGKFFGNNDPSIQIYNAFNRIQALSYHKEIPGYMGGGFSNTDFFIHTYATTVPAEKYFDAHPEYFPLQKGKRLASQQNNGQLCYTNPGVPCVFKEAILASLKDQPEGRIFSVSQNDNTNVVCECPECQALADGVPGGGLLLANRVAEMVAETLPDVRITTLAYVETQAVPKAIRPAKNTAVLYAPIRLRGDCLGYLPWTQVPQIMEELEGWSAISNHLYVWDYVNSVDSPPILDLLEENIRLWLEKGVTGAFIEDLEFVLCPMMPMRTWVLSQKLWNPALDLDALVEDFITGYYGAAAPEMREFVAFKRDAWKRFYANFQPGQRLVFSEEDQDHMSDLLHKAFAKCRDKRVAEEICALNMRRLRFCKKNEVAIYEARMQETLDLMKEFGIRLNVVFQDKEDKQIAEWKEQLEENKNSTPLPVYCPESITLKPTAVGPCDMIQEEGSATPMVARQFADRDWHVQWPFEKLIQLGGDQTSYVARIRVKPRLKKSYPAEDRAFSLHLWRGHGYESADGTQGRYITFGELTPNQWQFVYLYKVTLISPYAAGCFYNCIGKIAPEEDILYDFLEFIPIGQFQDQELLQKLPQVFL